ncbi:MAG: hypothetical protein ACWGHO_01175 [Candidatus Moraniibacteriota bacterium]
MKRIAGVKHCIFVPGGFITIDELKGMAKEGVCCLIILITKAAGKGERSHNLDIYAFDKKFVSPDEISVFEKDFGDGDLVTLDGVRSKIEEELTLEELIIINPCDLTSGENFQSQLIGKEIVR